MNDEEYKKWLKFLFDRDESGGDWHDSNVDENYRPSDLSIVLFTIKMFNNMQSDVCHYSDWQIATGLECLFYNTHSDFIFALSSESVELDLRLTAIRSIKNLYTFCFNIRCEPVLAHLSERGNRLNETCYMLWDATPLSYFEGYPHEKQISEAVFTVIEHALGLSNIACSESGLHALGHMSYRPEVLEMVARFLKCSGELDTRLIKYAEAAESGHVQ